MRAKCCTNCVSVYTQLYIVHKHILSCVQLTGRYDVINIKLYTCCLNMAQSRRQKDDFSILCRWRCNLCDRAEQFVCIYFNFGFWSCNVPFSCCAFIHPSVESTLRSFRLSFMQLKIHANLCWTKICAEIHAAGPKAAPRPLHNTWLIYIYIGIYLQRQILLTVVVPFSAFANIINESCLQPLLCSDATACISIETFDS